MLRDAYSYAHRDPDLNSNSDSNGDTDGRIVYSFRSVRVLLDFKRLNLRYIYLYDTRAQIRRLNRRTASGIQLLPNDNYRWMNTSSSLLHGNSDGHAHGHAHGYAHGRDAFSSGSFVCLTWIACEK